MGPKLLIIFKIINTGKCSVLSSDDIYCTERLRDTERLGSDTRCVRSFSRKNSSLHPVIQLYSEVKSATAY